MAAIFNWPPQVVTTNGNAGTDYWWADDSGDLSSLVYEASTGYYVGAIQDRFGNSEATTWDVHLNENGSLVTFGSAITAVDGSTYTTQNSVVLSGGSFYLKDLYHRFFSDQGNDTVLWCLATRNSDSVKVGLIRATGFSGGYATAEAIGEGGIFAIAKGDNSTYFGFFGKSVQTGGTAMNPQFDIIIHYTKFTTAGGFVTSTNLISPLGTTNQYGQALFDAGEGYYYLAYVLNDLYLTLRSVDLSSGTPVVGSILGGSGVAGWECTSLPTQVNQRYITLGGNRVIVIQSAAHTITITFTSGTKATPTIVKTARAPSASSTRFSVEYDPIGSVAHIIGWYVSGNNPVVIQAQYAPVASPGTAFTALTTVATVYPTATNVNRSRSWWAGCAQNGETTNSVIMTTVDYYDGFFFTPYMVTAAFLFWHEPVNYNLGVEINSTYTSVSATRQVERSRTVDIVSGYTSVEVGMALGGAHADDFRWLISESNEITAGVNIVSTYTSVSVGAEVIQILECYPLHQTWLQVGYTYMDDFMVYVNQDRAAVGLPAYKTFGVDGQFLLRKDVANLHANNMAWFRTFAHESTNFPPLQQTVVQRLDTMPASAGAENLLLSPFLDLTVPTNYGYISAYDAWEAWHNSPPHLANIQHNWGITYNDKAYSVLGAAEQWFPSNAGYEAFSTYKCVYLCNNFVILETVMYEISLQQFWNNSGALISKLEQLWSNDAWVHVAARHESPYAIRVAANGPELLWGCRVAAQHEAPITYSAALYFEFPYNEAYPVTQVWNEAGYAIKDTESVKRQVETEYAIRVTAHTELPYALALPATVWTEIGYAIKDTEPVTNQNEAGWSVRVMGMSEYPYSIQTQVEDFNSFDYSIKDTEPVAAQHEAKWSLIVSAQHSALWGINTTVRRQHTAPYGDIVPVRTQAQADYALLVANPIKVAMTHYYAMQDYVSTLVANSTVRVVFEDGTSVIVDDAVIDSAEGDTGYTFECTITDLSVFMRVEEDTPLVVDFCGELYNFVINSKSFTRNSGTDVSFRITATNAVVRLGAPYAQETDYVQDSALLASDLVDDLVAINFTYDIIDWTIPTGRLQAAGATSLEAVQQLVEAAGGVVDADIDGSMRIRYVYPHPMNDLASATPEQVYSDDYDNLSVSINTEYRDGANRFRVREGDVNFADAFEWVPDEIQSDPDYETGIVKAYLSPYRTSATIQHLGNAAYVIPTGEQTELLEELVEFNEGVGNVRRPIHTLLSVEWYTASLGSPAFAPYSTLLNVNTAVNNGYGIAKVTYNAKHLTAKVGGVPAVEGAGEVGPASSYAYFILEESDGN